MALIIGIAVVLFVPVLVWAAVIAGLIQIVRDRIRETRAAQIEPAQPVSTVADRLTLSWKTLG